ncbi:MAG: hypothetical protein PHH85_05685 [Candidatus Methanoperedens sp.]|nr:hypothetical protein [Candidatus Methanoperedens sp.]
MDCCGSSKPKENDKEAKTGKLSGENNPQKEQAHAGGGCCGGGGANGMWLHLVLMIILVIAISYFTKG